MHVAEKLKGLKIAIIGVGGTGSYVLDFLTKTHLGEIHIYDPDVFGQHNAFRTPGAATRDEVFAVPPIYKVDYLKDKYDPLHSAITPHRQAVTEIGPEFGGYDFVFICIDKPETKKPIVDGLIALNKSFIDVGLSVSLSECSLSGVLRTTMSTPACRDQRHKIAFTDDVDDDYRTPIQIAELNALNAALAVIRWKQELGFYRASRPRYSNLYSIDFNRIDNDEPKDANAS